MEPDIAYSWGMALSQNNPHTISSNHLIRLKKHLLFQIASNKFTAGLQPDEG
jgi:hypothetical protein